MNLQNMAPNVQRTLLLTLIFGALAAGIYFFAIESTETALAKARKTLHGETLRHRTQMGNLARADQVRAGLEKSEDALAVYQPALIKPLLESTAMRAKSFVDSIAAGCGLSGMEYEALPTIDLPIVGKAPTQRFVRCPIKISCSGSYQAAVSFLRCVEREFPLVALESLVITARANPAAQQIVFILEWPMEKKGAPTK